MTEKKHNIRESEKKSPEYGSHKSVYQKVSGSKQEYSCLNESKSGYYCKAINEFDRQSYINKMSAGSLKISAGTKWSEKGETPSFKKTDDILMKAARRTYKSHSSESQ